MKLFLSALLVATANAASNIVQIAEATPDLSTLVTALKAGGLVDTLSGPGPFTVFAPTNEAFAALPAKLLAYLLDPKHKAQLVDVLTYHVASGSVHAKDLKNDEKIKTVEGKDVEARLYDRRVFINQAEVTTADVDASNGVVHIINAVLIPTFVMTQFTSVVAASNIVQLAEATPDLSTLVAAVSAGGLVNTLESPGPFTVFAPTTEAFSALPAGVVSNLLKPENKATLDDVLTYHVVSGAVHAADLSDGQVIKTVEGKTLLATVNKTGVFINDAQVTTADVDASNGVVHIINAVLLPAAKAPTPAPAPAGKTIVDLAVATPDLSTLV